MFHYQKETNAVHMCSLIIFILMFFCFVFFLPGQKKKRFWGTRYITNTPIWTGFYIYGN